jgi:hypothetical protein
MFSFKRATKGKENNKDTIDAELSHQLVMKKYRMCEK